MKSLSLSIFASILLMCQGQNVEVQCDFNWETWAGMYICVAQTYHITPNSSQNVIITGVHLPNLTNLDVQMVRIHNQPVPIIISEFFTLFPNVKVLTIFGGVLKIQEDAFKFAENLESFSIFDSPLRVLPPYAIAGAQRLKDIGFVGCEIETIDEKAFVGLNDLNVVQVIISNLRSLPENIFSTLRNLSTVNIGASQLRTLPAKLFDNNLRLESVGFDDNNINSIARSFVDNLLNMENLRLFVFTGNSCGNSTWHPSNVDQIHTALQQCYQNNEQRRHFSLDLQGSLTIRDDNGNVILEV